MKISELNGLLKPEKEDYIPIVDNSEKETKKANISALLDLFYPVGSYYVTSDADFNPNESWGGTWNLDNDGTALVSQSLEVGSLFNANLGTIIGEEKHNHEYGLQVAVHWRDTIVENAFYTGALDYDENKNVKTSSWENKEGDVPEADRTIQVNSESSGSANFERVNYLRTHAKSELVSSIQPSKIVNRWHREA